MPIRVSNEALKQITLRQLDLASVDLIESTLEDAVLQQQLAKRLKSVNAEGITSLPLLPCLIRRFYDGREHLFHHGPCPVRDLCACHHAGRKRRDSVVEFPRHVRRRDANGNKVPCCSSSMAVSFTSVADRRVCCRGYRDRRRAYSSPPAPYGQNRLRPTPNSPAAPSRFGCGEIG